MINNVVLVGRTTKDPELKYIPGSGTPIATFTLAIDRDYKNKDGTITTDFIPVEILGKPAEFCANYITKGRLVGVQGSIRVDVYETTKGERRIFTKVAGKAVRLLEWEKNTNGQTGNSNATEGNIEGINSYESVNDDDVPF